MDDFKKKQIAIGAVAFALALFATAAVLVAVVKSYGIPGLVFTVLAGAVAVYLATREK